MLPDKVAEECKMCSEIQRDRDKADRDPLFVHYFLTYEHLKKNMHLIS